MKRAVLLQLPVPSFLWPVLDANIPLAAGYLAAWAGRIATDWEVEILPWAEVDVLGDEGLFHAIVRRAPNLVGLSLYLWNIERSLSLARRLFELGIPVVVGGPEVDLENAWLWKEGTFSAAIPGEGEQPFADILDALSRNAPVAGIRGLQPRAAFTYEAPPCLPVDLSALPSPYLTGCLPLSPDRSMWLETLRGCPFRCAYCHYGKSHGVPRPFPANWLSRHLSWALQNGVQEVYLMDPSFNVRRDWERTLTVLGEGNPEQRLAFHTEIVADALRRGDGARLAAAGLRTCEVGLQTTREEALSMVGRSWNRGRWVSGVRELVDSGISVSVGLIAGLPGDDLAGFQETIDFVRREVPGAHLQVFPLALLPGTPLRKRAQELGLESLTGPPYTVTRTPGYSPEDLAAAFDFFEEATGLELDPFGVPPLGGPWDSGKGESVPYLSGVRIDAARVTSDWPEAVVARAARNFCLWIRGWSDCVPKSVGQLARYLPHGVLTVVLEDVGRWPSDRLSAILDAAGTGDHYLDRYFRFLYGAGARVVPRMVALVEYDRKMAGRWLSGIRMHADLVWSLPATHGWVSRAFKASREGDTVYVRGNPSEEDVRLIRCELEEGAGEILFASRQAGRVWAALGRSNSGSTEHGTFRADEHRITLPQN